MTSVEKLVEDSVGWLTLNRPDKLNAINEEVMEEFDETFAALSHDDDVRVIIIRGAGRSFSVGYDITMPRDANRSRALNDWLHLREHLERWLTVWRSPKPVIAAVHGYCLGGATQLAVCCDLTIVAEDAVIGWPNLPLGGGLLAPVSCWLIGPKKAKELSYIVGSRMTGQEAVGLGWANHAVPAEEVQDAAALLAKRIMKTPPDLLAVKKRALNRVMDIQGFSEVVMFGAEFDAIAHNSDGYLAVREKISELGLEQSLKWFADM